MLLLMIYIAQNLKLNSFFQRNQNSNFEFDLAEINPGRSYGESQRARLKQIQGMGELMRAVCQIQVVNSACNGILSLYFLGGNLSGIGIISNYNCNINWVKIVNKVVLVSKLQNQMCKVTVKSIDSYFKQHECECQKSKTNVNFHFQNKDPLFFIFYF